MSSHPSGSPAPVRLDEALDIHGAPQRVALRGDGPANPVLLMLSGPGFAYRPLAPAYGCWESEFTVAFWDQPGSGESPLGAEPLSLERLARDGLAVAQALRARLPDAPLVPFGISGGSIVGLNMIAARPDLFDAYVGHGQVVNWARQAKLSYEMILARARAADEATAVAAIEGVGPPPWPDLAGDMVRGQYANALTVRETAAFADPAIRAAFAATPPQTREKSAQAFASLKPEIEAFDARPLGLGPEARMIFLQGAEDAHLVSSEVEAYARETGSAYVPLEGLGHMSSLLAADLLPHLRAQLAFLRPARD